VIADQIILAADEKLVWVIVTEVLFVHERKLPYIIKRTYVIGMYLFRFHPGVVEIGEGIEAVNQGLQQLELQIPQFLHGHLFDSGVPVSHLITQLDCHGIAC
jgi:hypothetical protein